MSDVEAGGATVFPDFGAAIRPRKVREVEECVWMWRNTMTRAMSACLLHMTCVPCGTPIWVSISTSEVLCALFCVAGQFVGSRSLIPPACLTLKIFTFNLPSDSGSAFAAKQSPYGFFLQMWQAATFYSFYITTICIHVHEEHVSEYIKCSLGSTSVPGILYSCVSTFLL